MSSLLCFVQSTKACTSIVYSWYSGKNKDQVSSFLSLSGLFSTPSIFSCFTKAAFLKYCYFSSLFPRDIFHRESYYFVQYPRYQDHRSYQPNASFSTPAKQLLRIIIIIMSPDQPDLPRSIHQSSSAAAALSTSFFFSSSLSFSR